MEIVKFLVLVYFTIFFVNTAIAIVLWRSTKEPLYKTLAQAWGTGIMTLGLQGMAMGKAPFLMVLAFAPNFLYTTFMTRILARVVGDQAHERTGLMVFAAAAVLSVVALLLNQAPWVVALPLSIAVGFPLLYGGGEALLGARRKNLTTVQKGLAIALILCGLHMVDYAWGHNVPEFALWGFTIAVVISFAISLFGLTAILEREAKNRAELEFQIAYKAKLANASKLSALGEMAGGMAHEINSPLAVIQLTSESARDQIHSGHVDPVFLVESLDRIAETSERIAEIVRALLSFSKDSKAERFEPVSVRKIIDQTLSFCAARIQSYGVEIRETPFSEDLVLECRPNQISQALLNLMTNAFDAASRGSEKWIELGVTGNDGSVAISVTDSGPRIRPEVAEKLFQPFFTTKEVGKGMGLGLSVALGLVQNHDGKLYLDSESQRTRLVMELPRRAKGAA